ncbi:hypothetical protein MNBD_GAMMA17-1434 [hydrothermal vent metagenome]|uniref:BrnT family toxin n=1 Tax=hydrothermal vent metagenome TaxID=652676 RepID=A0A3B0ZST2_9ZZZZ
MSVEDLEFEWDEDKNTVNIFKHGIDFWDAIYIWSDPIRQERYDIEHSNSNEDRWQTIGVSRFGVLMVVYTDKVNFEESDIRIISARKAESHEVKQYQTMTYSNGAML